MSRKPNIIQKTEPEDAIITIALFARVCPAAKCRVEAFGALESPGKSRRFPPAPGVTAVRLTDSAFAVTGMPQREAATASGIVDMPTTSAPICRRKRYSARVS